jgi:hypothetical protein
MEAPVIQIPVEPTGIPGSARTPAIYKPKTYLAQNQCRLPVSMRPMMDLNY